MAREQGGKRRGRPSEFSEKLGKRICDHLAAGRTLRAICRARGMPDERTVRGWARSELDFGEQYREAREAGYLCMADELRDLVDEDPERDGNGRVDNGAVQARRLKADTLKWLLSKVLPKIYGDRLAIAGDPEAPLEIRMSATEIAHRVQVLLTRGRERRLAAEAEARPVEAAVARQLSQEPAPLPSAPDPIARARARWQPRRDADPEAVAVALTCTGEAIVAARCGQWFAPLQRVLANGRDVFPHVGNAAVVVGSTENNGGEFLVDQLTQLGLVVQRVDPEEQERELWAKFNQVVDGDELELPPGGDLGDDEELAVALALLARSVPTPADQQTQALNDFRRKRAREQRGPRDPVFGGR